jgi:hypothetical protein
MQINTRYKKDVKTGIQRKYAYWTVDGNQGQFYIDNFDSKSLKRLDTLIEISKIKEWGRQRDKIKKIPWLKAYSGGTKEAAVKSFWGSVYTILEELRKDMESRKAAARNGSRTRAAQQIRAPRVPLLQFKALFNVSVIKERWDNFKKDGGSFVNGRVRPDLLPVLREELRPAFEVIEEIKQCLI